MQKRDEFTNYGESGYLNLLERIIETGNYRKPEGEEGRFELFAEPLRFDLTDNKLPLMTTKKVFFKSLAVEIAVILERSAGYRAARRIRCEDLGHLEELGKRGRPAVRLPVATLADRSERPAILRRRNGNRPDRRS